MKNDIEKIKTYTCKHCKHASETIGIVQKETHHYSWHLDTKQMEDFHGDESVESQKLFCLNCNKKITAELLS